MRNSSKWRKPPALIARRFAGPASFLLHLRNLGYVLCSAGLILASLPTARAVTYCPGDGPPPSPAPCPTIWQGRADCRAPIDEPPVWGASSAYWSSYPACNDTPGKCASEDAAWTAWENNITGLCQAPSTSYVCTDLYGGYQLGYDVHSVRIYSMTVGTGTSTNCSVWTEPAIGASQRTKVYCPQNFSPVSFNDGPCATVKYETCPFENPILCSGGQKMQTEADISDRRGGLSFVRYYSSSGFYASPLSKRAHEILGINWRHSWQSNVIVEPSQGAGLPPYAYVILPDGDYRHFSQSGSSWTGRLDKPDALQETVSGGVRTGWVFTAADDAIYRYDANGVWLSIERDGLVTTLTYSDVSTSPTIAPKPGLLIGVTDARGRSLELRYDAQAYLIQVTDPTGAIYGYRYLMQLQPGGVQNNSGRLLFADKPGGTSREYRYDEAAYAVSTVYSNQLTGIIDENGNRYGTYKYDSQGRAYQEFHGSGADFAALDYSYFYPQNPGSTITTNSLGQSERRRFTIVNGVMRDAGRDRCTTASCSATTNSSYVSYTSDGNRNLVTDFNGNVTDYDYNSRGLEEKRIEASTASGSSSPKRTTETQWHSTLNVPVLRQVKNAAGTIESVTKWAYNARGQETARCEVDPSDSAAMAYTCSAATAPPTAAAVRRSVSTYCEAADVTLGSCPLVGLLVSTNGPRATTDAGMGGIDDITTYTYYATTDETGCGTAGGVCHRQGDLQMITNALGQTTEYLTYDKMGRAARTRDANGTITDLAYNARGWLIQRTIRALASGTADTNDAAIAISYDNVGQITRVTQPDGVYLDYVYDNAHRLTHVVDTLGNRIHYTLDNAGNRIKEETFDATYNPSVPGQGLKRALARQYNMLGHLVRELNAANTATRDSTPYDSGGLTDGYDPNGNVVQFKDGLNVQAQRTYDSLNRLVKNIQDYTGTDPETGSATTEYTYDVRDNVRMVKDPDNLTTTYTYDGLGNQTALDSPDTGHTDYAYDRAGNRLSQTDNRSTTSSYTYDAANRLTGIGYPTSALNVAFHYDEGNGTTGCASSYPQGRLTRITDATGSTAYCYDRRGNVIGKTQITAGETLAVTYGYTLADRIATIIYPSGGLATYGYDAAGRVNLLTWKEAPSAATVTVVSGISYYPFGPANVLTYGSGRTLAKTYDQDYQIDSVASSATDGLKLDFGRDVMANITSASSTLGASPPDRSYVYDKLYRLTQVNDSAGAMLEDYNYNKTGDRTLKQFAGQAAQAYTYLVGTHRLGSVDGVNRIYDANGNTTDRGDGVVLGYDDRNRLASAAVAGNATTYGYSGRGERVLKVQANGGDAIADRYLYSEVGQLLFSLSTVSSPASSKKSEEYLYVDAVPVAVARTSGLSYLEADHLGTPRISANPGTDAKEWAWSLLGSAFGENLATVLTADKDLVLRFPGQWRDIETGLYYNYFRDYDSIVGRYVESDPIGLRGGIGTYDYVRSMPLKAFDPIGTEAWQGCPDGSVAPFGGCPNVPSKPDGCPNEAKLCEMLGGCGYEICCVFSRANYQRNSGNWNDPVLRPIENFAYVACYKDVPKIFIFLHQAQKLRPGSGTTPFSLCALKAGFRGKDSSSMTSADWKERCEDGKCK
jgi:RHS repeat-associated protein